MGPPVTYVPPRSAAVSARTMAEDQHGIVLAHRAVHRPRTGPERARDLRVLDRLVELIILTVAPLPPGGLSHPYASGGPGLPLGTTPPRTGVGAAIEGSGI